MKDTLYVANTSQGPITLNCSCYDKDNNYVTKYYTILPARECVVGTLLERDDWDRIKDTEIIKAWIDSGVLLPEKKKVTIDQETWKTSVPEPTGELADASLSNLAKGRKARTTVGSRNAQTELKA